MGNKNVQLVLLHCCKTSQLNSDVRVLSPTKKKNLTTLLVARLVRTWVVKRAAPWRHTHIQLVLPAALLQNKLHVFCCLFYCSVNEDKIIAWPVLNCQNLYLFPRETEGYERKEMNCPSLNLKEISLALHPSTSDANMNFDNLKLT